MKDRDFNYSWRHFGIACVALAIIAGANIYLLFVR